MSEWTHSSQQGVDNLGSEEAPVFGFHKVRFAAMRQLRASFYRWSEPGNPVVGFTSLFQFKALEKALDEGINHAFRLAKDAEKRAQIENREVREKDITNTHYMTLDYSFIEQLRKMKL